MLSVGKKTKPSTHGFEYSVSFSLCSFLNITGLLEQLVLPQVPELVLPQVLELVLPQELVPELALQLQPLPVSALLPFCSQLLQTIRRQRKAEKK